MKCKINKTCSTDPKFVGLDLSYTGTSLVVLDLNGEILKQALIKTHKDLTTEERILKIENEVSFIPNIVGLNIVYIEGPSFSSIGSSILQMGALNYYIRIFLLKNKVDFKIIPPPTLKKFVCGTGKAQKDLMLLNVYKKWGVSFDDNNLADAYGLSRMALEEYKK